MKKVLAYTLLIFSIASCAQPADSSPNGYIPYHLTEAYREAGTEPIYRPLDERMAELNVQGLNIVVLSNGEIDWNFSSGYRDREESTRVNAQTLFQAASISKPITGIGVLKLVQDGKLDLDTDINEYLTSWTLPKNKFTDSSKVTLRKLLSHAAGITVQGFPGYADGTEMPSTLEVLNGDGNTPTIEVDTVPGALWRYSGGGYVIIQQVIEDVTGMPFIQFMDEQILPNLGMSNSTFTQPIAERYRSNFSKAYHGNGMEYEGGWHNYPEAAPAGLWTTGEDLAHYIQFVHRVYTDSLTSDFFDKSLIEEMLTPYGEDAIWGLGPALEYQGDTLRMQHGGKNAGFSNIFMSYPAYGHAVIVMTNSDNGTVLRNEIMRSVSDYYDWNAAQQEDVERFNLSDDQKQMVAGTYLMEDGNGYSVDLVWENGTIRIDDGRDQTREAIIPVSETRFLDLSDGDELVFPDGIEAGKFVWNGYYVFYRQ